MLRVAIVSMAMMLVAGTAQADDYTLLAKVGSLKPNGQVIFPLTNIKHGELLTVTAEGSGKGDIDCYLITKDPTDKAWHVLALDERTDDACSIRVYPLTSNPIRLWILNQENKPNTFTVTVDQYKRQMVR